MSRDAVSTVQRHALERALVDETDARRYFALAGSLDGARHGQSPPGATDANTTPRTTTDTARAAPRESHDAESLLPVALLSLVVAVRSTESPPPAPSTPHSALSTAADQWAPGHDGTHEAVRRGARLALRWFDVDVARVAAHAGLPEAALTSRE